MFVARSARAGSVFPSEGQRGRFSASSSDVGLNLVGGTKFEVGDRLVPFAGFRLEAGGGSQFVVTGGLIF